MTTVNTGFLKLAKCAYIFDWSHSVYSYGTREQIKHKYAVEKELKTYYEDTEKRAEPLPYTKDENNNIFVEICGEAHALNDIQISEIDETDNIINHRRVINTADIIEQLPSFRPFCYDMLHNNLFRSFYIAVLISKSAFGPVRVPAITEDISVLSVRIFLLASSLMSHTCVSPNSQSDVLICRYNI